MPIRFFVSYAEKDAHLVQRLLGLIEPHLRVSRRHDHAVWEFHKLVAGERSDERIKSELAACNYGLLCISPEFLASGYIKTNEIPALLERAIPIGLKPVDFELHDWHSLDALQLFRLRTARGNLRCFSELHGAGRDAFALELFRHIEGRLG